MFIKITIYYCYLYIVWVVKSLFIISIAMAPNSLWVSTNLIFGVCIILKSRFHELWTKSHLGLISPQVSTVTRCLMDVRERAVGTEGPALLPATPHTASSANVLQ